MGKPDRLFLLLHRLGILHPAVCLSRYVRHEVLRGVHHNTQLITNQLARFDMVTDSLMQLPGAYCLPTGRGWREANYMLLADTFKDCYGYEHALATAQGRTAELILASTLAKPGKIVICNLLFPTTRLHPEVVGAQALATPIPEAYDLGSEHPFKGNLDIDALRTAIGKHGADQIAYVMVETSVNASGGHPVSMRNIQDAYRVANDAGVPLFIDACRLLENAWLIREREPGYSGRPVADIVREFCSHSDGCTMSATKDFPVDAGGFIATRRQELHYAFQDMLMLVGEGLSVDSKARLCAGVQSSFRDEGLLRRRVENAGALWRGLREGGVPVVSPVAGYAVFIDSGDLLRTIPEHQFPEPAFLAQLYLETGVLAAVNLLTPEQEARGIRLIRLAIPIGRYSPRAMNIVARKVAGLWHRRAELRGLQRTHRPPCRTGDFLAEYEPLP